MSYRICGKCLHGESSHTKYENHFMYCGACQSICDIEEFSIEHKPSMSIVQDGVKFDF